MVCVEVIILWNFWRRTLKIYNLNNRYFHQLLHTLIEVDIWAFTLYCCHIVIFYSRAPNLAFFVFITNFKQESFNSSLTLTRNYLEHWFCSFDLDSGQIISDLFNLRTSSWNLNNNDRLWPMPSHVPTSP